MYWEEFSKQFSQKFKVAKADEQTNNTLSQSFFAEMRKMGGWGFPKAPRRSLSRMHDRVQK